MVDGLNLYVFVIGNPVCLNDPNGFSGEDPPIKGEIGHIAPHNKQGKALYNDLGQRISEDEHIMSRGKQKAVTYDPATGKSDYTDSHYDNNTSLRIERDTALNKTHQNRGGSSADNAGTARLKQKVRNGDSINYRDEVFMESIDNAKRARTVTKSKITDGQINEAALAQDGELFGIQRMEDVGSRIGATADDVENALNNFDLSESPVTSGGQKISSGSAAMRIGSQALDLGGKADFCSWSRNGWLAVWNRDI